MQVQRMVLQSFLERDWAGTQAAALTPSFLIGDILSTAAQRELQQKGQEAHKHALSSHHSPKTHHCIRQQWTWVRPPHMTEPVCAHCRQWGAACEGCGALSIPLHGLYFSRYVSHCCNLLNCTALDHFPSCQSAFCA